MLIALGALTLDGEPTAEATAMPIDRVRKLEDGLDKLQNEKAVNDDVDSLSSKLSDI